MAELEAQSKTITCAVRDVMKLEFDDVRTATNFSIFEVFECYRAIFSEGKIN